MTERPPLIVIQCRFLSTRLPGKAMYPLAGIPMVAFLLRRLKAADLPGRLILAATTRTEDDAVAAWGRHEGVDVVRGEENNVLARYLRCLEAHPAPGAVRVTADNPFTDVGIIARVCEALVSGKWDYVDGLTGFACGVGVDGFSGALLETIASETAEARYLEHINDYVLDHPERFVCTRIEPPDGLLCGSARLTVDTLDDWRVLSGIIGDDPAAACGLPTSEVIRLIKKNSGQVQWGSRQETFLPHSRPRRI